MADNHSIFKLDVYITHVSMVRVLPNNVSMI